MKDGLYWVKRRGKWSIAECKCNLWITLTNTCSHKASFFDEIGDYIETPDKYKAELEDWK